MMGEVDCSRHEGHEEYWAPHPRTGRLVCSKCHPAPGATAVSKAMQRFIDSGGHRVPVR